MEKPSHTLPVDNVKPSLTGGRRQILGWSLYDFANTIYSMNIVSLYLNRYIVEDLGHDDRYFDIPFSLSMLLAAILLPALGTISDHSTKKKYFLFLFTLSCCIATGLMALVPSSIIILLTLFVVANFSYEAGQPFYNSLLYSVADGRKARFVSGMGVALGYVGSVVGMLIVMPFVTGALFSFDVPFLEGGGKPASFLPTAVLFMLFSLPLFYWVREAKIIKKGKISVAQAYRDVWEGLKQTRKYPGVLRFLIADFFVEDAVATVIIKIGLYCSIVLGFAEAQITQFLVISTTTAVGGSFIFGWIASRYSLKKTLNMVILGWITALILFVSFDNKILIWVLGSAIGVLLGGLWTTSRPLLAELVPREDLGRFYGLFSLSGRAAAIIGPLVWTTIVYFCAPDRILGKFLGSLLNLNQESMTVLPYKAGVVSLVIMMTIGFIIFQKVPDGEGGSSG